MNQAWIVLALVAAVLLGALLPLLRKDSGMPPRRDGQDGK